MEMTRLNQKQKQSKVTGSMASGVASMQKEANQLNAQSNTFQSLSQTFTGEAVKQLKFDAENKAMTDAGAGKLDMNSTQFTVYGQAYAKKANLIVQTNYKISLDDAQATALSENEFDLEGYDTQMKEFYDANIEAVPEDQLVYRNQSFDQSNMRGQRAIIKNKTDKVNAEYLASIHAGTIEARKSLLQSADEGDKVGYAKAQDEYVEYVSEMLENKLITPDKAVTLIQTQYDEGTQEFVLSDFDKVLDRDVSSAIEYAEKFSSAKDTDMFTDGDLLYDVPQRDAMYAKMIAKINAQTNTDKTVRAKKIKQNNGQVKNAIEVLKSGGNPDNLGQALSFSIDEIDPMLYEELRAEQNLLPERVAFSQATSTEQHRIIRDLEADRRAGKELSVYESRLLDGHKQQSKAKQARIKTDPASVRKEKLSGSMIEYDGTNMVQYLTEHQDSVNTFASGEGGKRWYFDESDAMVITDQYNNMSNNDKLKFISEIQTTLGDDSRHVFEQLGVESMQIVTLNQTNVLDPSMKTSKGILDGREMLNADKTLLPKEADEHYNGLDKSSMAEYTPMMRTQIKQDVYALAVANNGGGKSSNISSTQLQTAYDSIVGKQVSSRYFGMGQTVTAPWKGASYEDFEIGVGSIEEKDMPIFVGQDSSIILGLMQSGDSDVQYRNAGVGDYHVYVNEVRLLERVGEPITYTDADGVEHTRYRNQPYTMSIRKP